MQFAYYLIYRNKTIYLIFICSNYIQKLRFNLKTLMEIKRVKSIQNLELVKNDLLEFDFIILPGYLIDKLQDGFIDVFINTRSFMEMNLNTVNFYFSHIHRMIIEDGIFYCVNRYQKKTSGDLVKFKQLPFDTNGSLKSHDKAFRSL